MPNMRGKTLGFLIGVKSQICISNLKCTNFAFQSFHCKFGSYQRLPSYRLFCCRTKFKEFPAMLGVFFNFFIMKIRAIPSKTKLG